MIIQKRLNGGIGSWRVWHDGVHANSGETDTLILNATAANATDGDTIGGATATTIITRGTSATNPSGNQCIMYAWHSVEGFSKIGTYDGNGNANGPFVYLGFKPAWLIIKAATRTGRWRIWDNKRSPSNVTNTRISAESNDAESSGSTEAVDFLSNGFKIRTSEGQFNQSSVKIVYMAFAEDPFKYSEGR